MPLPKRPQDIQIKRVSRHSDAWGSPHPNTSPSERIIPILNSNAIRCACVSTLHQRSARRKSMMDDDDDQVRSIAMRNTKHEALSSPAHVQRPGLKWSMDGLKNRIFYANGAEISAHWKNELNEQQVRTKMSRKLLVGYQASIGDTVQHKRAMRHKNDRVL